MQCPVSHAQPSQQPPNPSAGKCPYHHSQPVSAEGVAIVGQNAERNISNKDAHMGGSPEAVAALNGCPFGYAASEPVKEPSAAAPVCPMGHGQQQILPEPDQDSAPAQCPMGFTSSDGPRMTQFHCVICKSLLYDCLQLSCSCKYCKHCVASFQDCPLCGADIKSRKPDPGLQGMVDQYIDAHAGKQNLFDIGKPDLDIKVRQATRQSKSAFLLQLAVRSAAGGNHPAAIDRLQKCKVELLRQVKTEGHITALCSQLGAVCGSQGDCHRQLDQPEQAKTCYGESVQHLKACTSQDAEVVHPLSVSYNKLGDLEYGLGNVQAAVSWYRQGLDVREQALQHGHHQEAGQQLDVAVSIIKVADACQALGQQEEASTMFTKALQLVKGVHGSNQDTPDVSARCQSLLAFLESRQS